MNDCCTFIAFLQLRKDELCSAFNTFFRRAPMTLAFVMAFSEMMNS